MNEIWKDIEGYEGIYQVSNLGRARSVDHITYGEGRCPEAPKHRKGRILTQRINNSGYYIINIRQNRRRKNYYVHRLVALAFVPGYFDGAQVNHKDENKLNNRWYNLEWVTRKDNCNYGTRNDRCNDWGAKNLWRAVIQYDTEGNVISVYRSIKAASIATGIAYSSIRYAISKKRIVNGFVFKDKTD